MDTAEIFVVAVGLALIALVLWYFFGEREGVAAQADASGVQEVRITVKGGYSPDVVVVKKGLPVRLDFYRDETSSCSERVVFGDFRIARDLPAYKTTHVEFTPDRAGEFTFTCGMSMMRGKLVVVDAGGAERAGRPAA
ncbi:MAG TPA: cupredoxin domain-containing protein [Pyrinomonadaceae bacterium]|nr:cupredoxin domain-containing protein [Pyrinomonadaceae bacterium]